MEAKKVTSFKFALLVKKFARRPNTKNVIWHRNSNKRCRARFAYFGALHFRYVVFKYVLGCRLHMVFFQKFNLPFSFPTRIVTYISNPTNIHSSEDLLFNLNVNICMLNFESLKRLIDGSSILLYLLSLQSRKKQKV